MTFKIPEDISALDAAALQAAIDTATQEAAAIDGEAEDLSNEQVEWLTALAGFVTVAREQIVTLAAETEARRTAAAEARKSLAPVADLPPEDGGEETEEEDPEEEQPEDNKLPVAAGGGRRQVVATASKKAPKVEPKTLSLIASADVPGISTGGQFSDMSAVSVAMQRKLDSLPKNRLGGSSGLRMRYAVASIERDSVRTDGLSQENFGRDDQALLQAARKESRLPGGSLTAAGGGWCAPSETIYDLCTTASTDGLLSMPETTINRGGIRYTSGPDFSAILDSITDFCMTEQDVIDGETKDCITVDCPDFIEARLEACWLCIKVPLLTQAGYPEYVRSFIDNAIVANAHKMSARDVLGIISGSTAVNATGNYGNATDTLSELELVATYQRQKFALADTTTLEVLLPSWFKTIIRADLARRADADLLSVSDAQITGYFTARQLNVQWLKYLYPITETAGALTIPATIDVPMYPAGTWVRGVKPVISLDAVYDSQSLAANEYTALFVEDGSLLAKMCYDSVKVTLGTCASGRTGAGDLADCVFGTVTP